MDPNQQPNNTPAGGPPQPTPGLQPVPQQPGYTYGPQPTPHPAQPPQGFTSTAAPSTQQPGYPQAPSAYQAPTAPQPYDPGYLDSIAPAAARPSFFSGSFGKILFIMLTLFVLAVSTIVAFSGQEKTADLQQVAVRLDNFSKTAKTVQPNIKSNNLSNINTNFTLWLTGAKGSAETLLQEGKIKKTDYDKKMVAKEKALTTGLDAKFEDARLNATLNRVYANSMASETAQIVSMLDTMAKKSQSSKIRSFAKDASTNLKPIQKSFEDYNDNGN